jgi:hypothetical protein
MQMLVLPQWLECSVERLELMNWKHAFIHDDFEAEGEVDGGFYRAWVGYGVLPYAWKARVQWYPTPFYYVASNGALPDAVTAQIWAEAALLQLRRVAEQLGEVKH